VTLRTKLVVYLVAAHVVFAAIALATLASRPAALIGAELILALSVATGVALVRAWIVPMRLVRSGTHLMQDGDFTAHFRQTGHAEIDAMIGVYNRMIDTLRDERARGREQEGFVQKLIAASPSGILTLDHDGRVRLTTELHDTEKAAYGKLIRMTTHEVNNSVAAVRSLLESMGTYAPQLVSDDRADFRKGIEVAVTRLDHLDTFMRGFADVVRLPAPALRPCVLKDLVDDIIVLMSPQLAARRIEVRWAEAADAGPSLLDRNQIEQVLLNVVKNAMEAIGEDGRITLALRSERGHVGLEITDSGPGLPDAARGHLFTPFFSTKKDGRGLGLTVVREILVQHRFEFELENADAGGARFRLRC